ncbi:MAG: hypothetical protein AAF682_08185 [Planctomycetota bacterium]
MRTLHRLAFALAPLSLAAPLSAQAVLVVDAAGGPGSDYTALQPALNAAQDGDLVLVRGGTYDAASAQGKGLTIAAAEGASPLIRAAMPSQAGLAFWEIPAGSTVELRGLRLRGTPGLWVWGSAGPALIDDCELEAQCFFGSSNNAALVVDESEVVVTASELTGASACANQPAGLRVRGGRAHVFGGEVDGVGFGANALELSGTSFAYVAGTALVGGDGADAYGSGLACSPGTDGGAALWLKQTAAGSPHAVTRDVALLPGSKGAAAPACPGGEHGVPVEVHGAATHQSEAGASYGLAVDSPVAAGAPFDLTLEGEPGDVALVLYSEAFAPAYLPSLAASAAPSLAALIVSPPAVVGAGGELAVSATLGLPPSQAFLRLAVQGVLVQPDGLSLSAPRSVLVTAPGV